MPKKNKYIIFTLIAVLLLVGVFLYRTKNSKLINEWSEKKVEKIATEPLKVGFITDAHCYSKQDKDTGEWTLNWRCQQPLEIFVKKMNEDFRPDAAIQSGDFIDGKDDHAEGTFIEAQKIFDQLTMSKLKVVGNHEVRDFTKQRWLEMTGNEKTYYHQDIKGYRLVVLDANNKPGQDGSSVDTSPELEYYPGFIDKDQMKWLEKLLKNSREYEVVVFVHQPTFATDAKEQRELFVGGEELRKLFAERGVRAVFSGHIERVCNFEENGVEYFVLKGFWKENGGLKEEFQYKKGGNFSEVTVLPDDVKVEMYHRVGRDMPYGSKEITPENYSCFDGATLADD